MTAVVQPDLTWMLRRPVRVLALGLGSGLLRPAPGTWGTLAGWLLWVLLIQPLDLDTGDMLVLLALAFLAGCWICAQAGRDLGVVDHGSIVWDEIVAIWLVLWLAPVSATGQLAGFLAFRLFDIMKPFPIRLFDRRLKNGFGVMWDDLLAAGYAVLLVNLLVRTGFVA